MSIIRICVAVVASVAFAAAQPPPATPPAARPAGPGPNDVVATIDGEKITPARLLQLRNSLPSQFRQAASRMDNKTFLKSYAELLVLAKLAEKENIADHEPYKGQLAFMQMNFLAQTYVDHVSKQIKPSQEDLMKYYDEHKAEYEEAGVRAIYVSFSPSAGKQESSDPKAKKVLTEEQAKAKAEGLSAELKNGADFAKLAKENSDDSATAGKGGDLGAIKKVGTGIPADIKTAIFALKPGEVSSPIRQPAGFYIFKVESIRTVPFQEVAGNISPTVQGLKMKEELDRIMKSVKITYENESFFKVEPGDPPAPARQ